jgi:quinol monooxygenase YgiN
MMFAKVYALTAQTDRQDQLKDALMGLAGVVEAVDGCREVLILQDQENACAFTFMERWESVEHHKASAGQIPKSCFGAVMEALAQPPSAKGMLQIPMAQT